MMGAEIHALSADETTVDVSGGLRHTHVASSGDMGSLVSLYAGAGGLDLGFREAGFQCVWANEMVADAAATHDDNLGHAMHVGDLLEQDLPEDHKDEVQVVVGGPPCFAAGTMVLTKAGYQPIEEIKVGEEVLTHKGRWRRVTSVMSRYADSTRLVCAQGCTRIRTTDEHPFYARNRTYAREKIKGVVRQVRHFQEPQWVESRSLLVAPSLGEASYLGQVLPRVGKTKLSLDSWWLVGRYLADGWLRRDAAVKMRGVIICCAYDEANALEERLLRIYPSTSFTRTRQRTTTRMEIRDHALYDILLGFGKGAAGKRLPGEVFGLPSESAKAILEGYFSGDGCERPNRSTMELHATTVSKALALGMSLLAQRAYGVVGGIREVEVPEKTVIEGRIVNQRKQYHIIIARRNRSAFVEGKYGWKLLRKNEDAPGCEVWNISVEEDESYTADGCIVHNCQGFSFIGKMDPTDPRSEHVFHFLDVVERLEPTAFVMENVKALAASPRWAPIREALKERASELGYENDIFLLNAADYGVPQARERMFLIGIKGARPRAPKPTVERHVTVREALARLPHYGEPGNDSICTARIVPAKRPILRPDPYGGNLLFNGNGRVLRLDSPALTLPASMGGNATPIIDQAELDEGAAPWVVAYHEHLRAGGAPWPVPSRLRRITVEEAAALQSFPPGFRFSGPQSSRYRQIGNAVPPLLARAVASEVKAVLTELRAGRTGPGSQGS
jgi:DNA (cytosine-5)-methyltransferase 1